MHFVSNLGHEVGKESPLPVEHVGPVEGVEVGPGVEPLLPTLYSAVQVTHGSTIPDITESPISISRSYIPNMNSFTR